MRVSCNRQSRVCVVPLAVRVWIAPRGVRRLTEDTLLCLSGGGGRFEAPPERCAVLERRSVRVLEMVRSEMGAAHETHGAYMARLEALCQQYGQMRQFVEKRCAAPLSPSTRTGTGTGTQT